MKTSTSYLSNLTPLRGIAALLTVIFHVDLMMGMGGDLLLKFKDSLLISKFYLMVDFFFVLSGFIMCHVYAKHFHETVRGSEFKRFTIARFARVYPLHLFSLLLTTFILFIGAQMGVREDVILQCENSVYSFITNLLLLQSMNLHDWFTYTHAAWSISTEWWMYMLFPFLVKPFFKLSAIGRLAVVALCFGGYLLIGFVLLPLVTVPDALSFFRTDTPPPYSLNVAYQFGFFRCMFGFILGMMTYKSFQENWGRRLLANGYTFLGLTLGLGLCLHFAVFDIFSVAFFPFMLLAAAYGSQNMNAFLGTKPLQRIGDWSFSIYLVHQPLMFLISFIINVVSPPPAASAGPPPKPDMLTGWMICLAFIALTLVVSYITYRFIEVPARNWINQQWGQRKVPITV